MRTINAFKFVLRFAWKNNKWYVITIAFAKIIEAIGILAEIYIPKLIIDGLIEKRDYTEILILIGIFCIILFMVGQIAIWTGCKIWTMQFKLQKKLISLVMQKTARIDYEYLENPEILDMKKKAEQSYLGNASEEFFGVIKYFFSIATKIATIVGIIALLFSLGFIPVFILTIIVILNCWLKAKNIKRNFKLEEESIPYERRWQYFRDLPLNLKAIKEIKCFNLSLWVVGKFENITDITTGYYGRSFTNTAKTDALCQISVMVKNLFSYGYVSFLVCKARISIGSYTMYLSAINKYSSVLQEILENILKFSHVGLYIEYLDKYLKLPEHILRNGERRITLNEQGFDIEFKNVSFRYANNEHYALKNINLKIHNQEHISIVGENGAGKTTLIKLLCRLYLPTEGVITLNGIDIQEYALEEYISIIAPVFQDFHLFSMSVKENIALDREFDEQRANQSFQLAALGYMPEKYQDFYNREVTKLFAEDGLNLSGGEQQKFSIARSLYCKDRYIVILDEPTAALDPRSEAEIYQTIDKLVGGKMSIFISHRLSSCRFCDRVVVLSKGGLVEVGTHEELMDKKGMYYELFELQAKNYRD